MAQVGLAVAGFLSLMVFLTVVLRYELDMATFLASILSVSVMSVGFMLAIVLQHFVGLTMLQVTMVLGVTMLMLTLAYEAST